jgi:hypothetical protein
MVTAATLLQFGRQRFHWAGEEAMKSKRHAVIGWKLNSIQSEQLSLLISEFCLIFLITSLRERCCAAPAGR